MGGWAKLVGSWCDASPLGQSFQSSGSGHCMPCRTVNWGQVVYSRFVKTVKSMSISNGVQNLCIVPTSIPRGFNE